MKIRFNTAVFVVALNFIAISGCTSSTAIDLDKYETITDAYIASLTSLHNSNSNPEVELDQSEKSEVLTLSEDTQTTEIENNEENSSLNLIAAVDTGIAVKEGVESSEPIEPNQITIPVEADSAEGSVQQEDSQAVEIAASIAESVSSNTEEVETQQVSNTSKKKAVKEINQKIKLESFSETVNNQNNVISRDNYNVGPGDVLEIAVFQVDELNRKVRISGDGMIMIPLLGGVNVNGMTTTGIEQYLTQKLGEDYLHDPQVSVFIDEFKSQQVAVLGAVKDPNIYDIRQPRTILEMLAQAGGLTDKAGTQIQVRRAVYNPETQVNEKESLIVDLDILLRGSDDVLDIALRGGDSVVVPEVGSVFVEGAVEKPGAYEMRGETNVLKVLSMAGGIIYETSKQGIEIYRETFSGETQVYQVSYQEIRENPDSDVALQEGDIVVVHHSSVKRGLAGFWRGITGIFRVAL